MFTIAMACFAIFTVAVISSKNPLFVKAKGSSARIDDVKSPRVSVVIPARNEERRIGGLLKDLNAQSVMPEQVIVVNDQSTDATPTIASNAGATVVEIEKIPAGWAPKPFVCHQGYLASRNDVVIFLDADVRVKPHFIAEVTNYFANESHEVLSIQPFHRTTSFVQTFSLFFHFVSLIGSGVLSRIPISGALFGPCIAMTRSAYEKSEGWANTQVSSSVIEDVELGKVAKSQKLHVERFLGAGLIEYTMYKNFHDVWRGWTKNISRGATQTPPIVLISLVAFLGSLIAVPFSIVVSSSTSEMGVRVVQLLLLWTLLIVVVQRVGTYVIAACTYPISLFVFFGIFTWSAFSMVTRRNVSWADRSLDMKESQ